MTKYQGLPVINVTEIRNITGDFNTMTTKDDEEYDYLYDYNATSSEIPLEELIPVSIFYGVTLLLGVTGNILVIFSICRFRRMQNVTNIFLTSLASADLMLLLLCVPIKFAKWFSFTWDLGEVLCKMVHYLQNVSVICSVLTLTAISLERYYAIVYPLRAKYNCTNKRAKKLIGLLWVLAFLLATPILFGQVHKEVGIYRKAFWCVKEWPEIWQSRLYEMCMFLVILAIPLSVITFAYCSICKELWIINSTRENFYAVKSYIKTPQTAGTDGDKKAFMEIPGNSKMLTFRRRIKPSKDDDHTRKQSSSVNECSIDCPPDDAVDVGGSHECEVKGPAPPLCSVECWYIFVVIKMLVAVIVLYALCWAPSVLDNLLVSFGLVEQYNYGYLKYMRQVFVLMGYTNSCVNPIVYAFMSKNFRSTFQKAVSSILRRDGGRRVNQFRQGSCRTSTGASVVFSRRNSSCVTRPMTLKPPGVEEMYNNGLSLSPVSYDFVFVDTKLSPKLQKQKKLHMNF